jgi:hypothetical protein
MIHDDRHFIGLGFVFDEQTDEIRKWISSDKDFIPLRMRLLHKTEFQEVIGEPCPLISDPF